jgi:hypothetical protein
MAVYRENHAEHANTQCGGSVEFLKLNLAVQTVTTRLESIILSSNDRTKCHILMCSVEIFTMFRFSAKWPTSVRKMSTSVPEVKPRSPRPLLTYFMTETTR